MASPDTIILLIVNYHVAIGGGQDPHPVGLIKVKVVTSDLASLDDVCHCTLNITLTRSQAKPRLTLGKAHHHHYRTQTRRSFNGHFPRQPI